MWRDSDLVVDHILWNHFPPAKTTLAREPLQRLFRLCYSRHIVGHDDALEQALVMSYPGRMQPPYVFRQEALVYLMARRGAVFGLSFTGDVQSAVDKLPQIARFLEDKEYDVTRFGSYELQLAEMLQAGMSAACTVQMLRHAPVVPDTYVRDYIVHERCREAFSDIQESFGYAGDCFLSMEVLPYLMRQFDPGSAAIASFRSKLDGKVLDLLDVLAGPYTHRPQQLALYNFFVTGNVTCDRNRAQALTELPWLLPVVADMEVDDWRITDPKGKYPLRRRAKLGRPVDEIRQAIDKGEPLFDTVASNLNVHKEAVRWSRRNVLPGAGYFGCYDADLLLVALSWLSRENRPATVAEWQRFAGILCDCLAIVCEFNYRYDGESVSSSPADRSLTVVRYEPLAGALARWVRGLFRKDRHVRNFSGWHDDRLHTRLSQVPAFLAAVYESIRRFCRNSSRGHAMNDQDAAYLQSWLTTRDIHDLLSRSDKFHQSAGTDAANAENPGSTEHHAGTQETATSWQSVLDQPFTWSDRYIHELCSTKELIEDGAAMNHCGGTYTGRCLFDNSLVFSVRDEQQNRCATVELKVDPTTLAVIIAAHVGPQNSKPDAISEAAVTRFVSQLNMPPYQETLRGRVQMHRARAAADNSIEISTLRMTDPDAYEQWLAQLAWQCAFGVEPAPLACYPALC